jgi:quercetin dioxygenase-like cupin family protein
MRDLLVLRVLGVGVALLLAASCTDNEPDDAGTATQAPAAEAPITRSAQDATLQWGPCPEIFPAGCEITVLHGDPARPNADVLLRVPGGYEIPPHAHTSAERMILVEGELSVHYRGAEETTLSTGEYAYGPAALPHSARCLSAGPCTLFIAFEGPVDATPFTGAID